MRRLGWIFTGVLLLAAPTYAQDTSRGEVSAGWRYYHATFSSLPPPIDIEDPTDYPRGWYADVAFNVSPTFAIVGEAGGTYFADESSGAEGTVSNRDSLEFTFHTFMGGIRVRASQHRAIVPFGQFLFGGQHDSGKAERTVQFGQSSSATLVHEASSSNPVLALDAGVTMMAGPIAIRVAGGYARFFSTADADAFRFSLGGGFRF